MAVINTIAAGQVSVPVQLAPGNIFTVTPGAGGSAVVTYTLGSQADINNNVATWSAWPLGTVSTSTSYPVGKWMFVRVQAVSSYVTTVTNTDPSKADTASFSSDWGTPGGGATAANVVKLGGSNGTPGSNAVGTGTLTTFPIGTISIPAGSLSGNNGVLTVVIAVGANNNGNAKTLTCTLNSQDLGVTYQMANLSAGEVTIRIQNKNATNAQQVRNTSAPNAVATQTTVDMTQAQNITILGTLTTLNDTMNVTSYSWNVSNV
jgi:hypothetical protein